jgi:hypothetical protein
MTHYRTLDQINADEARLNDEVKRRADKIANCEVENTDCALSMWAADQNARKLSLERELAENNGMAEFTGLFTPNGERVKAKRIDGKFGPCWMFLDANNKATGKFLPFHDHRHISKRAATNLRKKGYEVKAEWVKAGIASSCAAVGCPVNYYFYRLDGGLPTDSVEG